MIDTVKVRPLRTWQPKLGDFIIHHGFVWDKWYGIVRDVDRTGKIRVVRDGLPFLLLTTPLDRESEKTIELPSSKIARSRGGAYAVQQDGIWFIND